MRTYSLLILVAVGALAVGAALRPAIDGAADLVLPHHDDHPGDDHPGDDHAADEFAQYDEHLLCDEDDHDHSVHAADGHEDQAEHEDHVPLSAEAFANLGLRIGAVEPRDYTRSLRIPGEVVELPGVSEAEVAAPVAGVVVEVFALPGVSVEPGDPLFRLRVIDERLLDAQLDWLKTLTRLEIVDNELERLAPYAETGAVAGRKRIDLEYERRELVSRAELASQELRVRGLPEEQIEQVRETRRLADTVIVRLPATPTVVDERGEGSIVPVAFAEDLPSEALEMTVEKLFANPGQSVARGEPLCDLAHHRTLFVVGNAFEADMAALTAAAAADRTIAAEFGEEEQGGEPVVRSGLPIRFIAGHVDPDTQTYQVYATLPNESLHERRDSLGRRYRTWRHKVGQRTHLLIPTETLAGQFVLPRDAVVTEGPNAYVFREHDEHDGAAEESGLDHEEHEEHAVEFEPTPVVIAHRDINTVVVAPGGELRPGDHIAMNNAYQLYLAWKAQGETGGGGHHGHNH